MTAAFRTEINLKKGSFPSISHDSKITLLGSCFSDRIGDKFKDSKFKTLSNPFGVTYNPVSIANQISRIVQKKYLDQKDVIQKGEHFNSFDLHGSFDSKSAEELIKNVNAVIDQAHKSLSSCSHLFLTPATSWVYEEVRSGSIVNNCHKFPAKSFGKKILTVKQVVEALQSAIDTVRSIAPEVKIIFTISPVRHLKDGFSENSLSKSTLRLAIDEVVKNANCYYFPSYEMLMDDLRDYRFYEEDMIHPNHISVNYIWSKMTEAMLTDKSRQLLLELEKIRKNLSHHAFQPDSDAHKKFLHESLKQLIQIRNENPEINLEEEEEKLKTLLSE